MEWKLSLISIWPIVINLLIHKRTAAIVAQTTCQNQDREKESGNKSVPGGPNTLHTESVNFLQSSWRFLWLSPFGYSRHLTKMMWIGWCWRWRQNQAENAILVSLCSCVSPKYLQCAKPAARLLSNFHSLYMISIVVHTVVTYSYA